MAAEQNYGLLGEYAGAAGGTPEPGGDPVRWRALPVLEHSDAVALRVGADPSYLYLVLDGGPALDSTRYVVGIETQRGSGGERTLPGVSEVSDVGFEFALVLNDTSDAQLLVASAYNPYLVPRSGAGPTALDAFYHWGATVERASTRGAWDSLFVTTNRWRIGRDERTYAARGVNRGRLRYGRAAASSLADWYVDPDAGLIEVRLAWGLLNVTDPSSRRVLRRIVTTTRCAPGCPRARPSPGHRGRSRYGTSVSSRSTPRCATCGGVGEGGRRCAARARRSRGVARPPARGAAAGRRGGVSAGGLSRSARGLRAGARGRLEQRAGAVSARDLGQLGRQAGPFAGALRPAAPPRARGRRHHGGAGAGALLGRSLGGGGRVIRLRAGSRARSNGCAGRAGAHGGVERRPGPGGASVARGAGPAHGRARAVDRPRPDALLEGTAGPGRGVRRPGACARTAGSHGARARAGAARRRAAQCADDRRRRGGFRRQRVRGAGGVLRGVAQHGGAGHAAGGLAARVVGGDRGGELRRRGSGVRAARREGGSAGWAGRAATRAGRRRRDHAIDGGARAAAPAGQRHSGRHRLQSGAVRRDRHADRKRTRGERAGRERRRRSRAPLVALGRRRRCLAVGRQSALFGRRRRAGPGTAGRPGRSVRARHGLPAAWQRLLFAGPLLGARRACDYRLAPGALGCARGWRGRLTAGVPGRGPSAGVAPGLDAHARVGREQRDRAGGAAHEQRGGNCDGWGADRGVPLPHAGCAVPAGALGLRSQRAGVRTMLRYSTGP